jgi:putative nucleotidyltransferase with HDIG domain
MTKRFFREKPALALISLGIAIMLMVLYAIHQYSREHLELARQVLLQEAIAHFENIVVTRHWNSMYGGVYVKPHGGLQPNMFLKDNVLECQDGQELIKINPAWMTRQISELSNDSRGYYFHITSLNPLNPDNHADSFETRALEYFARQSSEPYYYEFSDDEQFNFVGALTTQHACLQCHAHQGYQENDIRGGIRVSLPMTLYREQVKLIQSRQWLLSIAVLVLGGIGTYLFGRLLHLIQRREREIIADNQSLERKVAEGTREVTNLFVREKYLRSILQIVADVNQLIITAQQEQSLLAQVGARLAAHYSYVSADIYMFNNGHINHYKAQANAEVQITERDAIPEPGKHVLLTKQHQIKHSRRLFEICLPVQIHAHILGVICVASSQAHDIEAEEIAMLTELSSDLGFAIHALRQRQHVTQLENERAANYEETILSFVHMIEQRDTYTAGHSMRVADYSAWIAKALGCDEASCERLHKAAVLHDIGKIATPDSILLKPENLNKLEYTLIKEHAIAGYNMLHKVSMYRDLAVIVRHHHEHHDGSGYPDQLAGDDIPFLARIIAVADAFDAMTTNRIYKARKSVEEALLEIERLSAKQFHPEIVKIALPILQARARPPETTQLPDTEIEKVRFAYFFFDQLTGLFNERYLKILLNNKKLPEFCHIFNFSGFAAYNRTFGWSSGDALLKRLGKVLRSRYPEHFLFRIRGDYFIIFSATQISVDVEAIKRAAEFPDTPELSLHYHSQHTYDFAGKSTLI